MKVDHAHAYAYTRRRSRQTASGLCVRNRRPLHSAGPGGGKPRIAVLEEQCVTVKTSPHGADGDAAHEPRATSHKWRTEQPTNGHDTPRADEHAGHVAIWQLSGDLWMGLEVQVSRGGRRALFDDGLPRSPLAKRNEMKQATGEHDVGRKWRGRSPAPGVPRRDSVRRTQSEEREHR